MLKDLPSIILEGKQLRKYRYLKRKYPVSDEFLKQNWENAKRFIIYALNPRCVLRIYAWRKRNRILLMRRSRLLLFDPRLKTMIKQRKANVKKWSSSIVGYYKKMGHITEYEETELYGEELSKQMKQQLELLKSGKRGLSLIEDANKNVELRIDKVESVAKQESLLKTKAKAASPAPAEEPPAGNADIDNPSVDSSLLVTDAEPPRCGAEKSPEKSTEIAGGSKFLDMLMNKVRVKNFAKESNFSNEANELEFSPNKSTTEAISEFSYSDEISEDFVGFDESVHQPGMLLTPLVPLSCKTVDGNAAFVSESLDAYMKKNNLRESGLEDQERLLEPMYQDGRVTAHSMPPHMDMPEVPESLQRLRTVAERRHYLQRSKNQKMAIINNEANVYRELLRKQRQRKVKIAAMQHLQSSGSQMPFTRQGWQAASYVATEYDKYYYQVIRIDGQMVRLPGSRGNNAQREKLPHRSQLTEHELAATKCGSKCIDRALRSKLQVMPTRYLNAHNKLQKLNQYPLPAIFRPCPLSQKPFQKPLDDDTAPLLLAGGSMAVVSMPTVQLDVKPQLGRPLDEIAKRYLQHILPHHDITREWAEFSVSTLQEPPNSMREAEAQAAQTPAGRRKSFTFVIPYLNDRNHILVRRVVDRSEKLDDSFSSSQPPEKLQEFEFRNKLSESPDAVELACADMINEMINTVAISCSENSFISIDPDAMTGSLDISPVKEEVLPAGKAEKSNSKLAANNKQQQQRRPNKQQRLAKELRRLNATIIDAAAIAKDANKPCLKDHCQLGCLCDSLAGELPARDHCARADCVLECRCTGAELTRVMRVETDGRGISNEDAFNLRRKATASLAKMEKDFTSTLVLTENETLLINETQCDKKRRCTKAPKRYEDFDDSIEDDEEELVQRPSKVSKREVSVKHAPATTDGKNYAQLSTLGAPCRVKDTDLDELKHCLVSVRRLPDVANLATFCMTHQLYKCFCGGLAPDGKPVVIESKKPSGATPEVVRRPHYSFERAQEEPQQKLQAKKKRKEKQQQLQQQLQPLPQPQPQLIKNIVPIKNQQKQITCSPPTLAVPPPAAATPPSPLPPPPAASAAALQNKPTHRSAELDIIFSYYRSRPYLCRRVITVPKNCYMRLNKSRAQRMQAEVARSENSETQELLTKRVIGAVRYYRAELDQQRLLEQRRLALKSQLEPPVIVVRDDSDECDASHVAAPMVAGATRKRAAAEPAKAAVEQPKRKKLPEKLSEKQPDKQPEKRTQNHSEEAKESEPKQQQMALQPEPKLEIQMPKISACYSLNAAVAPSINLVESSSENAVATAVDIAGIPDLGDPAVFRASYNDVIQKMNTHVSKKMQDIDLALQRESKIIPSPNEDILCIIKWTNFLGAFDSEYVFIWDVQMKNYNFLAATITNMMPAVCGAIAVVNTRFASEPKKLPLMARMLLAGKRNENTGRLAVVMQGRKQYWLVKGFLRYIEGNACAKPTPQTHPILTKKINVLCTLMVKQRIREQPKPSDALLNIKAPPPKAPPAAVVAAAAAAEVPPPSTAAPATATITVGCAGSISSAAAVAQPSAQNKEIQVNIRSNIEFRKVNQEDVAELQIPEMHAHDHRWVVLNLYDDFSHIFVPAFRDMVSLDRIHNVVRVAHESKKVVKLQFFQDAPYDAFVTPASRRKIYFGPLRLDMDPPVLVLLQSVDGKMMLREVYQREHKIQVQRTRRTMAFWVLRINEQVHFEIDVTPEGMTSLLKPADTKQLQLAQDQQQKQLQQMHTQDEDGGDVEDDEDDDDDDDCVIIDDDDDDAEQVDDTVKEQDAAEPEKLPIEQPNADSERINFTIQSLPSNGGNDLQITAAAQNSVGPIQEIVFPPSGGFLPFIANVPATGKTAPTTQFLTPQVQLTQTAALPAVQSAPTPPQAKISRISVRAATVTTCPTVTTVTTAGARLPNKEGAIKINESLQQLLSSGNGNFKIGAPTSGVTITKLNAKEAAVGSVSKVVEPIAIGNKRKQQESSTPPAKKAAAGTTTTTTTTIGQPTIIKQSATTISIGNLPMRQVRPPPPNLKSKVQLQSGRKSLPVKPPAANEARQSLPAKLPVSESVQSEQLKSQRLPLTATPNKASYGFLVANDLPRYRVKRLDSRFMIKVPDEGVLTFKNCAAASAYLNHHLMHNGTFKAHLPGDWKFLPYDNSPQKATQQQQQPQQQQRQHPPANSKSTKTLPNPIATPIVIED